MLVSVLLPTRQRVSLVERSVKTLLDNADNPSDIEILIAYDNNDLDSRVYFESLDWHNLIFDYGASYKTFKTNPWGYNGLHNYYNLLAAHSTGDWLMIWNDDAIMQSCAWDTEIKAHTGFIGMLHMVTENYREKFALFPIIPQVWIKIFGCVSMSNSNDSWIQHICLEAKAIQRIESTVYHDRYDVSGNNNDSTYASRTNQKKIYKSAPMQQLRKEWAQQLIKYRSQL